MNRLFMAGWELQVPIWLVLDDNHIVFLAEGVDLLSAFDRECSTSGILASSIILSAHIHIIFFSTFSVSFGKGYTHGTVYIK